MSTEDPPLSVIIRHKGPLVEIKITGDETADFPATIALIDTIAAEQLIEDLRNAVWDAIKVQVISGKL